MTSVVLYINCLSRGIIDSSNSLQILLIVKDAAYVEYTYLTKQYACMYCWISHEKACLYQFGGRPVQCWLRACADRSGRAYR